MEKVLSFKALKKRRRSHKRVFFGFKMRHIHKKSNFHLCDLSLNVFELKSLKIEGKSHKQMILSKKNLQEKVSENQKSTK